LGHTAKLTISGVRPKVVTMLILAHSLFRVNDISLNVTQTKELHQRSEKSIILL